MLCDEKNKRKDIKAVINGLARVAPLRLATAAITLKVFVWAVKAVVKARSKSGTDASIKTLMTA